MRAKQDAAKGTFSQAVLSYDEKPGIQAIGATAPNLPPVPGLEFVAWLETVNAHYPEDWKLRIILDNHSAHTSKETQRYLATVPNRFEFVFTPKHGSWLNLIEVFFSKLARTLLRQIRVVSKDELKQRILAYLDELNDTPVVFRWTYGLDDIA